MKLAIVGSRSLTDYTKFKAILLTNIFTKEDIKVDTIISGGASGVDRMAARFARENNIPLIEYIPDWNKNGKAAGFMRNKDIINNADIVLAVWDGVSKGTQHSINLTQKANKHLIIQQY